MWPVTPCWPTHVTPRAVLDAMCAVQPQPQQSAWPFSPTRNVACNAVLDACALESVAQRRAWCDYAGAVARMNSRAIRVQLGVS